MPALVRRNYIVTLLIVLVAGACAIYAAWLWRVGSETTLLFENSPVVLAGRAPVPAALAPLLASLVIIVASLAGWPRLAWGGAAFLIVMGVLWIFSIGLGFLLAGLLLAALLLFDRRATRVA